MTPNEFAFLALGLLLGIATGGAILVVVRSRPPTHDIRVTVTRDAIPRRASTLAADAVRGMADGPAPGGPGDRRQADRDGAGDRTGVHPDGLPVVASPILPWTTEPAHAPGLAPAHAPGLAAAPAGLAASGGRAIAIAIRPEPDAFLAGLGIGAARADAATGEATSARGRAAIASDAGVLVELLAGDHAAMRRAVEAVGGADEASQRAWDTLLTRFVEATRQRAIDLGFVDLPMGNPFWDTFTVEQCRQIVVALQATGRRYDGRSDWADGQVPAYRDLGRALAECGIEPRRIRAWPNSLEIAELFRGARVATAEAVSRTAPSLEADELRRFLDQRDRGLDELWSLWDAVRGALLGRETASP